MRRPVPPAGRRRLSPAAPPPRPESLHELAQQARCTRCPLYARATQAGAGEGSAHARILLVGEQPGDREDREGRPFAGPAGGILDKALQRSGIDRSDVYTTNAVKHFKWEERGKRRLHRTPGRLEVIATIHPSAVLRVQEGPAREEMTEQLVADLRLAEQAAGS